MRRNAIRLATAAATFLTAVAVGILFSSQLGQGWIRGEVERQLTRVMRGESSVETARLVFSDGLWLKAERIALYPATQGDRTGSPTLSAETAAARLDILAILTGRVRLSELEINGLQLRLERFADGSWSFPPLQALLEKRKRPNPDDPERSLWIMKLSEVVTRSLLTRPLPADRVLLHYATVTFVDHQTEHPGDGPITLHLRDIEARLEHPWLAKEAALSLSGQLMDSAGRRSSIEVFGGRREGQHLTLAATDLPLSMLGPYLARGGALASARGNLSGVFAYSTPNALHGALELDWQIRNLDLSIPLRDEPLHIKSPHLQLQSRIEMHPGRLRLVELHLDGLGGAGELNVSGVAERPLRDSAQVKLSAAVVGTGLAELRSIVAWLPETDALAMTRLLERFESGRIERFEARGGARLSQWRRLVRGELESLPAKFVLTTDVSDISIATDGPAALTNLSAHAEWNGDRISLRRLNADWKGVPLPQIDASVEGVSQLLRGPASERQLRSGAEPLPGLAALWRILAGKQRDKPPAPLPDMRLAVEALDHPFLRWPIRDTRMHLTSTPTGLEIIADQGTWAGVPFGAKAVWVREPEPHWNVAIAVAEPLGKASPDTSDGASPSSSASHCGAGWFCGRIEVDSLEAGGLPASELEARFALSGTTLTLQDVSGQLTPRGQLIGSLTVDLAEAQHLAVEIDVEVLEGELSQIAPLVGLGHDQWSGKLWFKAGLEGWVDPDVPLLSGLSGAAYVMSRQGTVQREIPLVLALAQATEGFNPLSRGKTAHYESVEMTLRLDRGRLSTSDLELDGPIRLQASGFLDVARPDPKVDAVVGVFLFRQADQILGRVPLLSLLISDQGLIGGFFRLDGSARHPRVQTLPLDSIASVIPEVVKAPIRALRAVGRFLGEDEEPMPPAKPTVDWPSSLNAWRQTIDERPLNEP